MSSVVNVQGSNMGVPGAGDMVLHATVVANVLVSEESVEALLVEDSRTCGDLARSHVHISSIGV